MRADLAAVFHVDLTHLWRERRWRTLIDLVNSLPSTSLLSTALANDELYARLIAENEDQLEAPADSSLVGQTYEVRILQDIYDLIAHAFGAKITYPRPKTEIDQARKRYQERQARSIIAVLTPWDRTAEGESHG